MRCCLLSVVINDEEVNLRMPRLPLYRTNAKDGAAVLHARYIRGC
jgi:hypothetical protein